MRLYHRNHRPVVLLAAAMLCAGAVLLSGCAAAQPAATQTLMTVSIQVDGEAVAVQAPEGSTAQQALDAAGIQLGALDRTEPSLFSVLAPGDNLRVVRVTEKFEVTQEVIPFERQTLRNESLPQGKENEVYLQRGKNGLREITIRRVFEDGVEVSSSPIKSTLLEEPEPEIVMIGIQAPFVPVAVPGRMVYLRDGNAWAIEGSTANRRAVVTTGDLDGRVFALSSDANWLLFSRAAQVEGQINGLWVVDLSAETPKIVDLKVPNVVHFADWVPGSTSKIVFSTVEPRSTAPGWQANNDLYALTFSPNGWVTPKWRDKPVLEANTGGIYGWWGMSFRWAPGGQQLAYTRPDGIGLVNFADGAMSSWVDIVPLQTRSDWAWVPGITWGPDGKTLYGVIHVPQPGSLSSEESPLFDVAAVPVEGGQPIHLAPQAGMFAYPLASPAQTTPGSEYAYRVAYLQAIFSNQSETSRYRVTVMDRDGSNRRVLFPDEGAQGLSPQENWGAWSPAPMPESGNLTLALIYQKNLWLVDAETGQAQQITGDGLTSRVIWK